VIRDSDADAALWNGFLAEHPGAGPYQTLWWRDVIQEVYGHRPLYTVCEARGEVTGILPLFQVRMRPLRSKLISVPYDMGWGGPLAADEDSEEALARHAGSLAGTLGVGHVELRCASRRKAIEGHAFRLSRPVHLTRLELTDEETLRKGVRKGHKDSLRTARKRGTTVRPAESLADVEAFYRVYLRFFRDFGTPPYGFRYFRTLWERLHPSGNVRLGLAYAGDELLGGLLLIRGHGVLVNKFTTCLPEAAPEKAYAALYWDALQHGVETGCRLFDFGTSSRAQEGLKRFKERWGGTSTEVHLYALPVKGSVPDVERYYDEEGLVRRLWRKMPLGLTPILGHRLNRWFC
jgi:CelD/BcsL family acetyltransferase involved in cellulose biosynthesis